MAVLSFIPPHVPQLREAYRAAVRAIFERDDPRAIAAALTEARAASGLTDLDAERIEAAYLEAAGSVFLWRLIEGAAAAHKERDALRAQLDAVLAENAHLKLARSAPTTATFTPVRNAAPSAPLSEVAQPSPVTKKPATYEKRPEVVKMPAAEVKTQPTAVIDQIQALVEQLRSVLHQADLLELEVIIGAYAGRLRQTTTLRAALLGSFVIGKSTLANALIRHEVLPSSPISTTSLPTEIRWGEQPRAWLYQHPGPGGSSITPRNLSLAELELYIGSASSPNHSGGARYARAIIEFPAQLCREGLVLIDLPGLNNTDESFRSMVRDSLPDADLILFILAADIPFSRTERDVFQSMALPTGADVLFVVNRFDLIRHHEQDQVRQSFIKMLEAHSSLGTRGIFFISARDALEASLASDPQGLRRSGLEPIERVLQILGQDQARRRIVRGVRLLNHALVDLRTHARANRFTNICREIERALPLLSI